VVTSCDLRACYVLFDICDSRLFVLQPAAGCDGTGEVLLLVGNPVSIGIHIMLSLGSRRNEN
jgi:hypothetical protein